jgi:hypothetical protein
VLGPTDAVDGGFAPVVLTIDDRLAAGLQHLTVAECPQPLAQIDGLALEHVESSGDGVRPSAAPTLSVVRSGAAASDDDFRLSVRGVDHVVVLADDVATTCAVIARHSGAQLRRMKEGDRGTQGFHRWGSVILEVVERRLVDPDAPRGASSYWGFVLTVDNLDEAIAHLGPDVLGAARPAVQPERRIATVRRAANLGVPLALMTP